MAGAVLGMASGALLGMAGQHHREQLEREQTENKMMDQMFIKQYQDHPEAALSDKFNQMAKKHLTKGTWEKMWPLLQVNAAEWQQAQERKIAQAKKVPGVLGENAAAALQQQIKDAQNLNQVIGTLFPQGGADPNAPAGGGGGLIASLENAGRGVENFGRRMVGLAPTTSPGAPPNVTTGISATGAPTARVGMPATGAVGAGPTAPPASITPRAGGPAPAVTGAGIPPVPQPPTPPAPPGPADATAGGTPATGAAPPTKPPSFADLADQATQLAALSYQTGDKEGAAQWTKMADLYQKEASFQAKDPNEVKPTADQQAIAQAYFNNRNFKDLDPQEKQRVLGIQQQLKADPAIAAFARSQDAWQKHFDKQEAARQAAEDRKDARTQAQFGASTRNLAAATIDKLEARRLVLEKDKTQTQEQKQTAADEMNDEVNRLKANIQDDIDAGRLPQNFKLSKPFPTYSVDPAGGFIASATANVPGGPYGATPGMIRPMTPPVPGAVRGSHAGHPGWMDPKTNNFYPD